MKQRTQRKAEEPVPSHHTTVPQESPSVILPADMLHCFHSITVVWSGDLSFNQHFSVLESIITKLPVCPYTNANIGTQLSLKTPSLHTHSGVESWVHALYVAMGIKKWLNIYFQPYFPDCKYHTRFSFLKSVHFSPNLLLIRVLFWSTW